LKTPDPTADERKRLLQILVTGARRLMEAPDTENLGEALELFDSLPEDLDEDRTRAAQRLLRVMAKSRSDAELQAALEKLTPHLGDEAEVRSNLRTIAEANRGKAGGLWAARVVTEQWPDGWDRWLDRSLAEASMGAFADAQKSLVQAEKQLSVFCAELPARYKEYDKVRRESAYGDMELKRCTQFSTLAAHALAYARQKPTATGIKSVQLDVSQAPVVPCLKSASHGSPTTDALVLFTPSAASTVDGVAAPDGFLTVTAGEHTIHFKDAARCRSQKINVIKDTATALRLVPPPQLNRTEPP